MFPQDVIKLDSVPEAAKKSASDLHHFMKLMMIIVLGTFICQGIVSSLAINFLSGIYYIHEPNKKRNDKYSLGCQLQHPFHGN